MKPPYETSEADYRPSVGIMLLNEVGDVFVARRVDSSHAGWQMPQGGIERGEEPSHAAFRELREEIGTDKAEIIAESKNWLQYDFPDEVLLPPKKGAWRGQRQKWFIMRFMGQMSDINLATEHPEFGEWKWAPVAEIANSVVSFKRQLYQDVLAEFHTLARHSDEQFTTFLAEPIIQLAMAADGVDERELIDLLIRISNGVRQKQP